MLLQGKRILFFSAKAFDIPDNITACMRQMGAVVDYYDERPANTFIVKALIRINRNLIAEYINKYHLQIINKTKENKYDYIFFIKGESISRRNLELLRSLHPQAKFIIYHWDSIANNKNALNLLPLFDQAYSFDQPDCEKLGMSFLPLFYIPEYEQIANTSSYVYDLMFVGTTHSDRYQFVKAIASQILNYGGKCFVYFFFQSKILFYKMKLQNKAMRHVSIHEVHFDSIKKEQLLKLYHQSRIIVDAQHPKQTGLTMRCIETLGAKRKLITTNQEIKKYDFYRPENILVVNRQHPIIPREFFESPYVNISDEIYRKYSLNSWIETIFK